MVYLGFCSDPGGSIRLSSRSRRGRRGRGQDAEAASHWLLAVARSGRAASCGGEHRKGGRGGSDGTRRTAASHLILSDRQRSSRLRQEDSSAAAPPCVDVSCSLSPLSLVLCNQKLTSPQQGRPVATLVRSVVLLYVIMTRGRSPSLGLRQDLLSGAAQTPHGGSLLL